MTTLFLKAKHWQLFLLTFGIPLIYQVIIMNLMMSDITKQTCSDPTIIFKYFRFFFIIMFLFMAVFYGWFWSVAIGLQKKVPQNINMKVGKFKIFFIFSMIYMTFMVVGINLLFNSFMKAEMQLNISNMAGMFALIIPLHLFAMFCIFYAMYFVAKTIKTVELQREVQFSDFVGEFFLIWFYAIGIWILQPKINKMMEEETQRYDYLNY